MNAFIGIVLILMGIAAHTLSKIEIDSEYVIPPGKFAKSLRRTISTILIFGGIIEVCSIFL